MNPPRKRQRITTGCQACRERHQKCDDNEPCQQCELHGLDCVKQVNVRFRSSNQDPLNAFPPGQRWLSPPSQVQYRDETSEIAQHYEQISWEAVAPLGTIISYTGTSPSPNQSTTVSVANFDYVPSKHSRTGPLPPRSPTVESHASGASLLQSSPRYTQLEQMSDFRPSPTQPVTSPFTNESPASLNSTSVAPSYRLRPNPKLIPFDEREAELTRNFSENMALWADITDIKRHFEIEVTRRACFNLIIRYAICAFSSRHINRSEGGLLSESLFYHNKCLELLIPILSNLDHELTEDILAAVAILRLDEEMEVQDNCFHLQGITRILNQVSSFCSGGGLGEATAWLCVRQEIYISLVNQQPLRTQVANFEHSSSFRRNDDLSWANRIVLLLAQILSIAFLDPNPENSEKLRILGERVEGWMRDKPPTFEPIKYIPKAKKSPHRFPIIWMLHPFHVLGVQYYYIAKIVLDVSASQADANKRHFFWQATDVGRRVRAHLLTVIGLAKSNPKAENTLFTARHTLTVWGSVLTKRADQEAAKDFLKDMEERTGWTNSKLIANLEEQWDASDDD